MDDNCKVCGEEMFTIRKGVCENCLSKLYDEHETEMLPFFVKYPPDEWDEDCHEDIGTLWARANVERFYMRFNQYALTRHYLKQYALEDLGCLEEWMEERGWI